MTPDADSFRALARSSPWRWRTLLLRARASWLGGEVVAYAAWQEMDVLEVDAPAPDWAQVAS
ncbi:hypothetical protein QI633_04640 [Nocardioides sp. QY071]|uniref:hypothetical protein n=1 Tax=Nocardioides sp. QY071 TaxID=3044187 RepID=UPI00249AD46B|nr:hypothetical protein [Nocardioides sp. QY071]WGY03044.1 hypothetical protein QI633_04640 [Nocardioides sp. QY071]